MVPMLDYDTYLEKTPEEIVPAVSIVTMYEYVLYDIINLNKFNLAHSYCSTGSARGSSLDGLGSQFD